MRIRVGASLDGSPSSVFKSLGEMAKKARAQVQGELAKSGEPLAVSVKANTAKAERAMAELKAKISGQDLMAPGTRAIKQFGDDAAKRFEETKRRFKELSGEVVRGAKEIEKAEKQASASAAAASKRDARLAAEGRTGVRGWLMGEGVSKFRGRADQVGLSVARGALSGATRLAGDIASGAGVQFDTASHVANNADLQARTVNLSNAGYMPGVSGANGERVDPAKLEAQAREVANAVAVAPSEAIAGLEAFVAKTGDLQTGRDVLADMARLAKASGSSLEDMLDAAGDVANGLGEIDNKGAAINETMKSFAAMGKMGAVEIKDVAVQMAKVVAAAGQFSGNREQNIIRLGALMQGARSLGGASSAASAATALSSFAGTFAKGARLKAFRAFGVKTQDATGGIRDAEDITLESVVAAAAKSRGGIGALHENLGQMFMDKEARKVVRPFEDAYRNAYNGAGGSEADKVAAGVEAMKKLVAGLNEARMKETEVTNSLNAALDTTASKAQIANNAMDTFAKQVTSSLGPTMDAMASIVPAWAAAAGDWFKRGVRGLSGQDAIDEEQASMKAVAAGEGDTSVIKAALRTGTALPEGTLEKANADEAVLRQALAQAQSDAAKKNEAVNMAVAASYGPDGAPVAPSVRGAASEAEAYATVVQKQYEALHDAIKKITDRPLEVKVVNPPPTPAPKVPSGPGSGRPNVSQ